MFKKLAIVFSLFFSISAFSQIDETIFLNNHLGFEFAANYPGQNQHLIKTYDNLYSNIRVKIPSQLGSKIGLNYYFYFNDKIGLYSGFKYSQQKYYLSFSGDFYNFYENDFKLLTHNILEIPFGLKLNFAGSNNFFDLGLGLNYLHFIFKPEIFDNELININNTDTFNLRTIPSNEINPFFLDINFGYNIIQDNKNIVRIGIYYQRAFSTKTINTVEFYDNSNDLLYSSRIDLKANIGISFSYTLSYNKRLKKYIDKTVKEKEKKIKGVIDL